MSSWLSDAAIHRYKSQKGLVHSKRKFYLPHAPDIQAALSIIMSVEVFLSADIGGTNTRLRLYEVLASEQFVNLQLDSVER